MSTATATRTEIPPVTEPAPAVEPQAVQDPALTQAQRPAWFAAVAADMSVSVAHTFLLHGAVHDYVGQGYDVARYLEGVFAARPQVEVVVTFSLDRGFTFQQPSMRRRFEQVLGLSAPQDDAFALLAGQAAPGDGLDAPLPNAPLDALRLLARFLQLAEPQTACAIVERVDLMAPPGDLTLLPDAGRGLLAVLHRTGTDREREGKYNPLFLLAPSIEDVHPVIRAATSGIRAIHLPLPDYDARKAYLAFKAACEPDLSFTMGLDALAAMTAGLQKRHIEDVLLRSGAQGLVTRELVRQRKSEIMAAEYAEVLEQREPSFGFDRVGGQEPAKAWLRRKIVGPIKAGRTDRMPKGVALLGPAGTGKTLLADALAYETGWNCVELRAEKIKGGIVGESERRLAKAIDGIESLAPCVLFIDEIDQRFRRGGGGAGDGGSAVENNIFSRLLEFLGSPRNRGRIFTVVASNRPDLIDAALFRPGRIDAKLPILPPETPDERADVFRRLLQRELGSGEPRWLAEAETALPRLGAMTEGWTGAEIERAVMEALSDASVDSESLTLAEWLEATCARLRPGTRDITYMTMLAVRECDDVSLLPQRYQTLLDNRDELEQTIRQQQPADPERAAAGRRRRAEFDL